MCTKSQSLMIHQHKKINHSTNLNDHLGIAEVRLRGLVISKCLSLRNSDCKYHVTGSASSGFLPDGYYNEKNSLKYCGLLHNSFARTVSYDAP